MRDMYVMEGYSQFHQGWTQPLQLERNLLVWNQASPGGVNIGKSRWIRKRKPRFTILVEFTAGIIQILWGKFSFETTSILIINRYNPARTLNEEY